MTDDGWSGRRSMTRMAFCTEALGGRGVYRKTENVSIFTRRLVDDWLDCRNLHFNSSLLLATKSLVGLWVSLNKRLRQEALSFSRYDCGVACLGPLWPPSAQQALLLLVHAILPTLLYLVSLSALASSLIDHSSRHLKVSFAVRRFGYRTTLKLEILIFSLPTGRIFATKPGNVNGGQFVIEANDCKPSQYNFIPHAQAGAGRVSNAANSITTTASPIRCPRAWEALVASHLLWNIYRDRPNVARRSAPAFRPVCQKKIKAS